MPEVIIQLIIVMLVCGFCYWVKTGPSDAPARWAVRADCGCLVIILIAVICCSTRQADMLFLRSTRQRCESIGFKAVLTMMGLVMAGAAGLIWVGFKTSMKTALPFALPLILLLALAAAAFARSISASLSVIGTMSPRPNARMVSFSRSISARCMIQDCRNNGRVRHCDNQLALPHRERQ
jgi:hypothetical protein